MGSGEKPWQSYHTVFTNAKAGMDGVDKDKVQRVVYEMSKGSRYFENEQRREAMVKLRVQHMQEQAAQLTVDDLQNYEKMADSKIVELEASRDLSRTWMHVDLDAFYAAVETLEDQSLLGKPMAVGGMSMICTANYEARKYGVRAAMPGFIACKLCSDLIFVPPNFEKYTRYSEQIREVFREYDPQFLARSLDEAYLDITDQCRNRGIDAGELAEELRRHVYDKTGLTCSAGVGPNRLVAKVCSDINKPNGQYIVPNERAAVMTFISTLPIRKVNGIGKVTERLLKEVLDINICEDILQKRALITALFSPLSSDFFLSVNLGIGGSETPVEDCRKSLSCERTFSATSCETSLFTKLEELVDNLAKDLELEGLHGRTLTLKLKTIDFEVRTRSLTLPSFIHKKEDLMSHFNKLLKAELPVSLRLMGLRISQFRSNLVDSRQRTLSDFLHAHNILNGESPSLSCKDDNAAESCNFSEGDMHDNASLMVRKDDNDLLKCFPHDHMGLDLQAGFCSDDSYKSVGAKFLDSMYWIDDYHCSLCGFEIPACFSHERQEHTDFHLAQMLQQSTDGRFNFNAISSRESKRLQSPSSKETPPKKGRISKTDGPKEKGRHLPIDTFFQKTS